MQRLIPWILDLTTNGCQGTSDTDGLEKSVYSKFGRDSFSTSPQGRPDPEIFSSFFSVGYGYRRTLWNGWSKRELIFVTIAFFKKELEKLPKKNDVRPGGGQRSLMPSWTTKKEIKLRHQGIYLEYYEFCTRCIIINLQTSSRIDWPHWKAITSLVDPMAFVPNYR